MFDAEDACVPATVNVLVDPRSATPVRLVPAPEKEVAVTAPENHPAANRVPVEPRSYVAVVDGMTLREVSVPVIVPPVRFSAFA